MTTQTALGSELALMAAVCEMGSQHDVTPDDWQRIAGNYDLMRYLTKCLRAAQDFTAPRPTFKVVVDYRRTWEEQLKAALCMECFPNRVAPAHEPHRGLVKLPVELFFFYETTDRGGMHAVLERLNYRAATLLETLALLEWQGRHIWRLCEEWKMPQHTARSEPKSLLLFNSDPNECVCRTVELAPKQRERDGTWFSLGEVVMMHYAMAYNYLVPAIRK